MNLRIAHGHNFNPEPDTSDPKSLKPYSYSKPELPMPLNLSPPNPKP